MKKESRIRRFLLPVVLMLIGISFVLFGVIDGEAGSVLRKAVAICMECIGIG